MNVRKLRSGERVSMESGDTTMICYVYSITTNHVVLKMPNQKLWCLTINEFELRVR